MTIRGILIQKYDTEQVSEKFKKRQLVIKTEETYPQTIPLQLTQDKCSLLDSFKIGDNLKVSINIRGKEWVNPQGETKYFASLEVWKLEKLVGSDYVAEPTQGNDNDSGLPF
jgi:single-strand DNA-binding protein